MRADEWRALADSRGPVSVVDWACLDHGSEQQEELSLTADGGRISVGRSFYSCGTDGKRGSLLRTEPE
jgi:hypothetical protein